MSKKETIHCDDIIHNFKYPLCVRWFLFINRVPAADKLLYFEKYPDDNTQLYADLNGKRVRVIMASRFGDLGVTFDLTKSYGYSQRVNISELYNFSDKP